MIRLMGLVDWDDSTDGSPSRVPAVKLRLTPASVGCRKHCRLRLSTRDFLRDGSCNIPCLECKGYINGMMFGNSL